MLGTILRVAQVGAVALAVAQGVRNYFWEEDDEDENEDEAEDDDEDELIGTDEFDRSLQRDTYSCGSRSAYMIACHFQLGLTHGEVKEAVGTTEDDGTYVKPLIRFFREHGLKVGHRSQMQFRDLRDALAQGAIVLVSLDGDHYGVVHGMTDHYVLLADPSLIRQVRRQITHKSFKKRWMNWGLVVRE